MNSETIQYQQRDLRGSRLRCLMATSLSDAQVAHWLTALVSPHATVNTTQDRWMPRGLLEPAEAKSGNANAALNTVMPGWNLSHGSHYQIANRFSWAWKLAQLGVPVALVYLGFLHAEDVADVGTPLSSADQWSSLMRQHASGIVPEAAWGSRLGISGTSLVPLTRSMTIRVEAL